MFERRVGGWRRQAPKAGADAVMFTSVSPAVGFSAPEPKAAAGGNMNGAYVVSSGGKVGVPFTYRVKFWMYLAGVEDEASINESPII